MSALSERLEVLGACSSGIHWAAGFDDPQAAWAACQRGDWMLWLLGCFAGQRWSDARKPVLASGIACAELAAPHWPQEYADSIAAALGTLRSWIDGLADADQARAACADLFSCWSHKCFVLPVFGAAVSVGHLALADAYMAAEYAGEIPVYVARVLAPSGQISVRLPVLARCADLVRLHSPEPPVPG